MKKVEQNKDWEDEMKEMAPWLPLNGFYFQKMEAPKDYFETFEKHLNEKIKSGKEKNIGFTRLQPIMVMAAGILLLIFIGKYHWFSAIENNIEEEYDISTLSKEEADLWLKEEAIISKLDLQLYVEGLTLTESEK